MTRPNALVGALAAVGIGMLLWCAWLILAADLTTGASIAAWVLWLLVAAALTTLVGFVREVVRQHRTASRRGRVRPLPSLMLLWIGGLAALAVFAVVLPSTAAAPTSGQASGPVAGAGSPAAGTPTPTSAPTSAATPRSSPTAASRSRTRPSTASAAATPRVTTTTAPQARSSSTPTPPPSTTSTPIITLPPLPRGHQTTKPPRTS